MDIYIIVCIAFLYYILFINKYSYYSGVGGGEELVLSRLLVFAYKELL